MTITVPWRRMTLQLSHRVLTDALTFTGFLDLLLLQAVGDPTPREVVGRQLHADPVPGQDPDEVHPELAADVRKDAMPVLELDREHRVRQWLDDGAFDLDRVLLRQPCSLVLLSNECRPAGPTHERSAYQTSSYPTNLRPSARGRFSSAFGGRIVDPRFQCHRSQTVVRI